MNNLTKKIIMLLTAFAVTTQPVVFAQTAEKEIDTSIEYQGYEMISDYIANQYIDDTYTAEDIMKLGVSSYLEKYGDDALVEFLKGALHALDDYSDFFTREEYIEYMNEINSTFYGLGVSLQQNGEYVEIVEFVEEGGLAQQSGFQVGDKIVAVGGVDVVGCSVTEVRNLVVGELGTAVDITVLRGDERINLVGIRTAVNTSTVSGTVLKDGIGYVKILSFSKNTAEEFTDIVNKMKSENVKKLILDLRNNGGGQVIAAVDVARQIVPKGKIIDVEYRDKNLNHTYNSDLREPPFKIVTLVNEHTASSAEILASAIQDSGVGILMGENTYGKAVIQSPFYVNNGMVIKLTIGSYITRNGNEINKVGLIPDILVENEKKKVDTSAYTKFDFITPVSLGASGDNVMAAKERLSDMNYYSGNMHNDVYNVDLKESVALFQRKHGLTDSGVLDIPTQIKLKEVFEQLDMELDTQLDEAYKYLGGKIEDLE